MASIETLPTLPLTLRAAINNAALLPCAPLVALIRLNVSVAEVTSNLAAGLLVPIPTLPPLAPPLIRIFSEPPV